MTTLCTAVRPTDTCTVQVGGFRLIRRGRFWVVKDPENALVCVTVYKKGALEVVRRLLPPEERHLTDEVKRQRLTTSPRCRYSAHSR